MIILDEKIDILRGTTYQHTFYVLDNTSSVVDSSAFDCYLDVIAKNGERVSFTQYLDNEAMASNGVILLTLEPTVTSMLPFKSGEFDLKIKNKADGKIDVIAVGSVTISDTITNIA
jgi:hypothetical protein